MEGVFLYMPSPPLAASVYCVLSLSTLRRVGPTYSGFENRIRFAPSKNILVGEKILVDRVERGLISSSPRMLCASRPTLAWH